MKIITINLNPVYDIFYSIKDFKPFKENIADNISVFTGGKGTNVSRVLHVNGCDNTAYILLGKENCQAFVDGIKKDGLSCRLFYTDGRIRENITLLSDGIPETRICINDFYADSETLDIILAEIAKEAEDDECVIVCSGKFPKGITPEKAVDFVKKLKRTAKRVALDSNTFSAEQVLEIKPWLIKPNEEEIEALTEISSDSIEKMSKAAKKLHDGGIDNVMITLGGAGAVYYGELGSCIASVPKLSPLSTIGAGDSTVAGFISAYRDGLGLAETIRRACAFGTAACLEEGTRPPTPENIKKIAEKIDIQII